jgi:hypothetical protein
VRVTKACVRVAESTAPAVSAARRERVTTPRSAASVAGAVSAAVLVNA